MTYYVQIVKNNRACGELKRGKVVSRGQGTRYTARGKALACANSFVQRHGEIECRVRHAVTGALANAFIRLDAIPPTRHALHQAAIAYAEASHDGRYELLPELRLHLVRAAIQFYKEMKR